MTNAAMGASGNHCFSGPCHFFVKLPCPNSFDFSAAARTALIMATSKQDFSLGFKCEISDLKWALAGHLAGLRLRV
jgi:hypothetical protein